MNRDWKSDNSQRTGNTPTHYKGPVQPIDLIETFGLSFSAGNVIKYICRYRAKGGLEDLEKARWYLDRLIQQFPVDKQTGNK